ncbi:hypothetical protein X975_06066, partial [Stegodyphus mimosarum]
MNVVSNKLCIDLVYKICFRRHYLSFLQHTGTIIFKLFCKE